MLIKTLVKHKLMTPQERTHIYTTTNSQSVDRKQASMLNILTFTLVLLLLAHNILSGTIHVASASFVRI